MDETLLISLLIDEYQDLFASRTLFIVAFGCEDLLSRIRYKILN